MPRQAATKRHYRTCNLCEAMCGLVIEHDGARVLKIEADKDDPLSAGHICPKAFALRDVYEDPDRLKRPLRRRETPTGEVQWDEVPWDEALDEVVARLKQIGREHGPDAVAVYQGNPTVHNLGSLLSSPAFVRSLGTKNRYSATSVDQLPHHFASYFLFGHQLLFAVPDVDRTDHLLVLGANPLVSNGSMMTAPGMRKRIKAIQARGGKVVVVDPRRTETAERADAHHFITPGTDGLLLAAIVQRIGATVGPKLGRIEAFTDGVESVMRAVAPFTPENVAPHTGIAAEDICTIADEFAAAQSAVCYGRMGVSTASFGALNVYLGTVINAITANLDRPGGAMFTTPAVDILGLTGRGGFGRWKSRVRGLPEFGGELPVVVLSEEIETPGDGQVRALVTSAGNPVLSTPDGKRLDKALETLDFMVSIDPWINETTRHADFILPPRTGLEVPHYDLVFHALAVRNTAKYADPLFEGDADGRFDIEIFGGLLRRMKGGRGSALSRLAERAQSYVSASRQLDVALRRGPYGAWGGRALQANRLSVAALRASPSGIDLGPLQQDQLPALLKTIDKRINLAPEPLIADFERLQGLLSQTTTIADSPYDLRLIGRRGLSDNNSWLHNAPTLVKGRNRCTLLMHPDDASARGLSDGDDATLSSRVGAVRAPIEITDAMMPGVVCLPHGWGHSAEGTRLSVASKHAGVSINDVTDPSLVDELSGNAAFSGVPVAVSSVSSVSGA